MTTPRDLSRYRPDLFAWLPRALDHLDLSGISKETVLSAVRQPEHISIEPSSQLVEHRWYAERRRRGDVTVIVAFPPHDHPVIWGAYYNLPFEPTKVRSVGGAGGSTMPTSMREVKRRLIAHGLIIRSGGKHDRAETPDGTLVATLAVTTSDSRSIANLVRTLARKGIDIT